MNKKIKILLADDDSRFIQGFKLLLRFEDMIEVIGFANNGEEALEIIKEKGADIAVLDIEMPVKNGFETLAEIKRNNLPLKTIILTAYSDSTNFNKAIALKADGYVLKDNYEEEIVKAVFSVASGKTYYSRQLYGYLKNKNEKRN